MDMLEILKEAGIWDGQAQPFHAAEDGASYQVWKVTTPEKTLVLKKAKGLELSVYEAFFREPIPGAPQFLKSFTFGGEDYFLMKYVEGEDLCKCTREGLTKALDALISLQERYWGDTVHETVGYPYSESLAKRRSRGEYLNDPQLEEAYGQFLRLYETLPRTLCHDDLLPFNVLVSQEKATIIDWEVAGILPYPTSLARLIAHGSEETDAFFYLREDDREFAIEYYYENLVSKKGISYPDYRRAVDYFLLFEYCEWIMLGNKYPDADMERYRQYYDKAKKHICMLNNKRDG